VVVVGRTTLAQLHQELTLVAQVEQEINLQVAQVHLAHKTHQVAQAVEAAVSSLLVVMLQEILVELVVTAEAVVVQATTLVLVELAEQVFSIYTIKEN
jgi:hypothetical protein